MYYEKNKEIYKQRALNYYRNNRSKCIERMKEYNKRYYQERVKCVNKIIENNKKYIIINREQIIISFE